MSTNTKLTKNQKKKQKKKDRKDENIDNIRVLPHSKTAAAAAPATATGETDGEDEDGKGVEVEYVSADYDADAEASELMAEFKDIFSKFAKPEDLTTAPTSDALKLEKDGIDAGDNKGDSHGEERETEEEDSNTKRGISKKKKRLMSRLSVAELKQLVLRPDVVEAHDVTSSDPRLLVYLKAYRNTVPVPRHWCAKRKYLQGKRGMEKIPFQLPEYIADTGIARIRESVLEQESAKKSKQKARDKLQPKMGKIDIDFQVLHDAFFKHQTKPKMTGHGDLYYEGKEFEVDLKEKKAGILSDELKIALGMTSDTVPPPWLVNMQRYGPPPSYPTLRIPGLNAPIPSGAQFGFHVGGWGKPPVDEYGRSLYGDVFGVFVDKEMPEEQVDKTFRWGAIASGEGLSEADDDDEEAEDEGELAEGEDAGFPAGAETPTTLQGISSMASGLETPSTIDLRKRMGTETPDTVFDPDEAPKELYHVIQERQSSVSGQLFGSDRAYKLPGASAGAVSAELEDKEDVGDKRKQMSNKKGESLASNAAKKYKDFKF